VKSHYTWGEIERHFFISKKGLCTAAPRAPCFSILEGSFILFLPFPRFSLLVTSGDAWVSLRFDYSGGVGSIRCARTALLESVAKLRYRSSRISKKRGTHATLKEHAPFETRTPPHVQRVTVAAAEMTVVAYVRGYNNWTSPIDAHP
jgi:hypothetical protein